MTDKFINKTMNKEKEKKKNITFIKVNNQKEDLSTKGEDAIKIPKSPASPRSPRSIRSPLFGKQTPKMSKSPSIQQQRTQPLTPGLQLSVGTNELSLTDSGSYDSAPDATTLSPTFKMMSGIIDPQSAYRIQKMIKKTKRKERQKKVDFMAAIRQKELEAEQEKERQLEERRR